MKEKKIIIIIGWERLEKYIIIRKHASGIKGLVAGYRSKVLWEMIN